MSYSHFTLEERDLLQQKLNSGESIRSIASFLGRSPSSVSRELRRNSLPSGAYAPYKAQLKAESRRKNSYVRRLKPGSEVYQFVVDKLQCYWSPEAIAGRWKFVHDEPLGVSTIYRALKRGELQPATVEHNLRRRGVKYYKSRSKYQTITPDRLILDWPEQIKGRRRIGDWEGDTILGKIGSGLITTLIDRKSRYLLAAKANTKRADEHQCIIESLLKDKPCHSISFDNGVEFARFHEIEKHLNTEVYFAEPHKPWQRGSSENVNGVLRFFFPRGLDFKKITQEDVDKVVDLINDRPRKCLGWKTPREVLLQSVALT